jgi:hypothetical protein
MNAVEQWEHPALRSPTWWVAEACALQAQPLVAAQRNGHVAPRLGLAAAAAAAARTLQSENVHSLM